MGIEEKIVHYFKVLWCIVNTNFNDIMLFLMFHIRKFHLKSNDFIVEPPLSRF